MNTILQDIAINKEISAGNLNASLEAVLTLSRTEIFEANVDPAVTQVTMVRVFVYSIVGEIHFTLLLIK